jgi:hypothetical protein
MFKISKNFQNFQKNVQNFQKKTLPRHFHEWIRTLLSDLSVARRDALKLSTILGLYQIIHPPEMCATVLLPTKHSLTLEVKELSYYN